MRRIISRITAIPTCVCVSHLAASKPALAGIGFMGEDGKHAWILLVGIVIGAAGIHVYRRLRGS